MNLLKNEAVILSLLISEREMYGLEMVKKSEGKLKLGTIYLTLSRMEEKGLATSRKELDPSAVVPRRLYKISGMGADVYHAWTAALDAFNSRLPGAGQAHQASKPEHSSAISFDYVEIFQ
jgi:DNA-binding PadR family transcriptional regulator